MVRKRDMRMSVPIDDAAKKALDKILREENMTLAVFLRTSINYYIANHLNKKPIEFTYRNWRKRS